MKEWKERIMNAPSYNGVRCPVCGDIATNRHHVVKRSQGGSDGATVSLCGFGNASGCHGLAHSMQLHFDYLSGWVFLRTKQPTKLQTALEMDGWQPFVMFEDLEQW